MEVSEIYSADKVGMVFLYILLDQVTLYGVQAGNMYVDHSGVAGDARRRQEI